MTPWTEEELDRFPVQDGVRLRGVDMTRLETFTDAAFAFAITMLVISVSAIPGNFTELLQALKRVPAFAASFSHIMLFWFAHRKWSRRYGLEDRPTTLLSLALVFVMLVYIYPLRLMFSSFFAWITNDWLPSEFVLGPVSDLTGLFVVYGIGFGALAGAQALLYRRTLAVAANLRLNALEQIKTRQDAASWALHAATGFASAAFAGFMPLRVGVWAGFIYFALPIGSTWIAVRFSKLAGKTTPSP